MRRLAFVMMAVLLANGSALAQTTTDAPASTASTTAPTTTHDHPEVADEKTWSFSISAYTYIVPDGQDYVQPTVTANYVWLHLEARYNYEALDTGSAWVGYNISVGDKLTLEVTPMIGAVFGDTNGVAPGYEIFLSYGQFELYTEGEYLFDSDDSSGNFFYTWSELTYSPMDWLHVGVVIQRTKAYESDLDIQRGLLIGFSYKQVDFTTYVFNLGWEDPTFVLMVGITF